MLISFAQKPVFEGVAQEALAECVRSLQFASNAIKNEKVYCAIIRIILFPIIVDE